MVSAVVSEEREISEALNCTCAEGSSSVSGEEVHAAKALIAAAANTEYMILSNIMKVIVFEVEGRGC